MRESMQEIKDLLTARMDFIWVESYEETEFVKELVQLVATNFRGRKVFTWSMTDGLKQVPFTSIETPEPPNLEARDPIRLLKMIENAQNDTETRAENIYVLKDLHLPIEIVRQFTRAIRDTKEAPGRNYCPIIAISPTVSIPLELEKLVRVVKYDTPSKEANRLIIQDFVGRMAIANTEKNKGYAIPTPEVQESIIQAISGLTYREIKDTLALSLTKYKTLSLDAIMDEKIQLIKKSGVLDYKIPQAEFDQVGGNENFKNWIEDVELAMSDEAKAFGCPSPKGYLALGIPGTAKTYMAEALANRFRVPFIKLDMSRIMDKLVGNSEKKIDQALRIVKACAPCIFLIDEVEKALGGIKSSNSSDAGTSARVFASILQFLQDNNNVFVVMTSNDVSQLPPELTRPGRLDAMWYFSTPTEEERRQIFKIHLDKAGRAYEEGIIEAAAKEAENYTGAEIECIVKTTLWKAFRRSREDGEEIIKEVDILSSIHDVVPVYESSKEKILYLESWVKGRARYSSAVMDKNGFNSRRDDELLKLALDND